MEETYDERGESGISAEMTGRRLPSSVGRQDKNDFE